MIVSEEVEKEKSRKQQRTIPMSDERGSYEDDELINNLKEYLSKQRETPRRIRKILLPFCLDKKIVNRNEIKKELLDKKEAKDDTHAGRILTTISRELGLKKHDYLRQVILYEKASQSEKENFKIDNKYKEMIERLLRELKNSDMESNE